MSGDAKTTGDFVADGISVAVAGEFQPTTGLSQRDRQKQKVRKQVPPCS